MYCSRMYGVIFGGGHDLYVSSDANTNQDSYSKLGYTYQPPAGYKPGTPQTKSLLAGSEYFTPTEVEVFCNQNASYEVSGEYINSCNINKN